MLSVAVLLVWQVFYAGPKLKEEQERRQRIQQEQQAQAKEQPGAPKAAPQAPRARRRSRAPPLPAGAPAAAPARRARRRSRPARAFASRRRACKGSIALKGGRIDDLVLAKYHETVDPKSPNVVLFSPSGAPHPYYAEYGWVPGSGVDPADARRAIPSGRWRRTAPLTPSSPVTLVWDNGQGLVFRRTIAVDADYLFTVTDEVENKTAGERHPAPLRA